MRAKQHANRQLAELERLEFERLRSTSHVVLRHSLLLLSALQPLYHGNTDDRSTFSAGCRVGAWPGVGSIVGRDRALGVRVN